MLYNMNTEFCDGFWVGSFSQCSVVIQHLVLIFKFFLNLAAKMSTRNIFYLSTIQEFGKDISEN